MAVHSQCRFKGRFDSPLEVHHNIVNLEPPDATRLSEEKIMKMSFFLIFYVCFILFFLIATLT